MVLSHGPSVPRPREHTTPPRTAARGGCRFWRPVAGWFALAASLSWLFRLSAAGEINSCSLACQQVIAYTRSKLHFAMLSLFLELRALLPNAIVGAITRESMRKALATGIKGRQVLDFLKWHAHPVVRRRTPVVPENIADQVRRGALRGGAGEGTGGD